MKTKMYLLVSLILTFCAQKLMAQDYDNPSVYMDVIGKQQENVSKKYMSYTSASAHGKKEKKVDKLRTSLMDEIQEARMNINSMPSFKGDKMYRDTAVNFMKFYYNVMNDDYSKILNMEELAEQSYDEMELYLLAEEKIQEKLAKSNASMQAAQQLFASKNNIKLSADNSELGAMMNESAEVSKYYHQVYLLFFKPFMQEKNLLKAMDKNNITGLEQSKSAMVKYAQEGLEKIATLKPYKGDNNLLSACKNILNFYIKEAEKTTALSDYYTVKEKFEKLKIDMDKKQDRNKADVDNFNKAVADINKASQSFNTTNQQLNNQRNQTLNDWNNAVKTYFDNHTPRYK